MKPKHEIATLLKEQWQNIEASHRLTSHQKRMLKALAQCRTAALGGHIDKCSAPGCGYIRISYNSCRNRHCPKCQGAQREKWIQAREEDLLPVGYFHLVFTLPHALNPLAMSQPKLIYGLLFKVAWQTMKQFATDPKHLGAETGMTAILHTWGQNLSLHPHLHCIVPAGGLTASNKWKSAKSKGKFLFPVKAMSKVFRAKFAKALRKEARERQIDLKPSLFQQLFAKKWVIYAKSPFGGPKQVLEYLGRYTHKVAISNHRIKKIDTQTITFSYKDYKHGGKYKSLSLQKQEFIRRFALHILPKAFVRIRHYGLLASRAKAKKLQIAREDLEKFPQKTNLYTSFNKPTPEPFEPEVCPDCGSRSMKTIEVFLPRRAPPIILTKNTTM